MRKIKLDCDACGAPLPVADPAGLYKCPYCGRSYFIEGDARPGAGQQRKRPKITGVRPARIPEERKTVAITEEMMSKIKELLSRGAKIQAIKLYRDETGVGLKEAKDYVENIEEER